MGGGGSEWVCGVCVCVYESVSVCLCLCQCLLCLFWYAVGGTVRQLPRRCVERQHVLVVGGAGDPGTRYEGRPARLLEAARQVQGSGQGCPAAPQGPHDCKPSTLNFPILPLV